MYINDFLACNGLYYGIDDSLPDKKSNCRFLVVEWLLSGYARLEWPTDLNLQRMRKSVSYSSHHVCLSVCQSVCLSVCHALILEITDN